MTPPLLGENGFLLHLLNAVGLVFKGLNMFTVSGILKSGDEKAEEVIFLSFVTSVFGCGSCPLSMMCLTFIHLVWSELHSFLWLNSILLNGYPMFYLFIS